LDIKINEDSKNVLKIVILSLQVCFKGDFVADYLSNCVSVSSNFDTALLLDCVKFCSVFQVIG